MLSTRSTSSLLLSGQAPAFRCGVSQDEPEALTVRTGRFGRKLLLVSIENVDRIDPDQRRVILTDPPRLLSD